MNFLNFQGVYVVSFRFNLGDLTFFEKLELFIGMDVEECVDRSFEVYLELEFSSN